MTDSFVHLHVHTEYSILDGAARIKELIGETAAMGMPAIAMTDHGNMYAALDFYRECRKQGVKPIIGAELYVATRSRFEKSSREKDGSRHLTVLATSDQGYRNLMKIVSAGHLDGFFYRPRVDKEILSAHSEGIVVLTGCLASEVNEHLKSGDVEAATSSAGEYAEIFGKDNVYVELQDHGIADQHKVFPQLLEVARRTGLPTVATNDLHYTRKTDAAAHDVLLCIQTNAKVGDANRFKFDGEEFYLKSPEAMRELFRDHRDACDATLEIAERCQIEIEFGTLHLPPFTPPDGESQEDYLRRLTYEGAEQRYGSPLPLNHRERIEHELNVIISMGFAGYFLIVADLIAFARSRGIRVGPGRGSAAGCVVSYCLRITDLDPMRYGLIFERFLNPERRQMPDIDMDFDERRRGEVIRYATEKYGEDHVAQIITFGTIKGKQAIRDAARVLDLPYTVGDRLAKMYPPAILGKEAPLAACFDKSIAWPDKEVARNDAFQNASDLRKAYEEEDMSRQVIDIARTLEGLRRQVSVHAAGVVIADRPIVEYVPLKRADEANGGGIVTQYEMGGVESLGLLKMDFLGLRNLTVLTDTIANLTRTKGIDLDIDNVPLEDRETFRMLTAGYTIGVFQLESPGMRELVKRLRPDSFGDVMALVALYRPGPLGQGMHIEYAERKHGNRKVTYLHPDLEPILNETFGIILYQEQALRIAVDMAGFSMAEADTLRKAIGKKIADVMRAQKEKFIAGCVAKGYTEELGTQLWTLIDEFSGYGFNKSHSAGYALIAYQTAYLKATHPVEYFAALLTSVRGNQDRSALYLAECRALGIRVHPPDVNLSDSDYTPTKNGEIRFGLSAVRNIGEHVVALIVKEREERGLFKSFTDFCHRVDATVLNKRVVEALVKAGAFDSLWEEGAAKRAAFLEWGTDKRTGLPTLGLSEPAAKMLEAAAEDRRNEAAGQSSLFGAEERQSMTTVSEPVSSGAIIDKRALLTAEKEMLGLYVSDHPLLAVEASLRDLCDTQIADVETLEEGRTVTIGGIISRSQKKFTKKGEAMGVLTLEDLAGAIEVVVFPSTYLSLPAEVIAQDAIVVVKGKVDVREEPPKIVAQEITKPVLAVSEAPATRNEPGDPKPLSGGAVADTTRRAANGRRRAAARTGDDTLVLRLSAERAGDPAFVAELRGVLSSHPGPTPVHLHLTSGEGTTKVLRLADDYQVERRQGLYAELKAILGSGAVE
ncbi:MAG TPA: DNA polymerase III subunit alpha [Actinomycetota bacterium]|nr:DNA polymerase III subunit alpha [Actinomycetota bacterium]